MERTCLECGTILERKERERDRCWIERKHCNLECSRRRLGKLLASYYNTHNAREAATHKNGKKRCNSCKEWKLMSFDFWIKGSSKDGFQTYCKICTHVRSREYRKSRYLSLSEKRRKRYWLNPQKYRELANNATEKRRKHKPGETYMWQFPNTNYYKIGYTTRGWGARLKDIKTDYYTDPILINKVYTPDANGLEKLLFKRLRYKKIPARREIFQLSILEAQEVVQFMNDFATQHPLN